jgi:hypothetical protein
MHEPETPILEAPEEIRDLARLRAAARRDHEWAVADDLRAQIEAAGWKVADDGLRSRLEPAHPPDIVVEGRTRYGASASVPSRLDEPATFRATVVLVADRWPEDVARALGGLPARAPGDIQLVVVANAPTPEQAAALETVPDEVVWTSAPLGHAAALNIGVRRAVGAVVVLLDASLEPRGDFVTPLVAVLDDPAVGLVGPWGLESPDLRHFDESNGTEVDAIRGTCMAFRRSDYAARGPFDERFRTEPHLDAWWSLVLRDEGPDRAPRLARRLDGLLLERHPRRTGAPISDEEAARLARRNFYRVIDRFGGRRDLLAHATAGAWRSHRRGAIAARDD